LLTAGEVAARGLRAVDTGLATVLGARDLAGHAGGAHDEGVARCSRRAADLTDAAHARAARARTDGRAGRRRNEAVGGVGGIDERSVVRGVSPAVGAAARVGGIDGRVAARGVAERAVGETVSAFMLVVGVIEVAQVQPAR